MQKIQENVLMFFKIFIVALINFLTGFVAAAQRIKRLEQQENCLDVLQLLFRFLLSVVYLSQCNFWAT